MEHPQDEHSSQPTIEERSDEELLALEVGPIFGPPSPQWAAYGFRTLTEFQRWASLRRAAHEASQPSRVLIPKPQR